MCVCLLLNVCVSLLLIVCVCLLLIVCSPRVRAQVTEQRSAVVAFETSLLIIYGIRECYTSLLLKYPVLGSDTLDCMNR